MHTIDWTTLLNIVNKSHAVRLDDQLAETFIVDECITIQGQKVFTFCKNENKKMLIVNRSISVLDNNGDIHQIFVLEKVHPLALC